MGEYTIEEDRVKLTLYTAGNLCLTLILMFICAEFMNRIFYLGVFLGATGIWFSVKYMFRYGKKLFAGTIEQMLEVEMALDEIIWLITLLCNQSIDMKNE